MKIAIKRPATETITVYLGLEKILNLLTVKFVCNSILNFLNVYMIYLTLE